MPGRLFGHLSIARGVGCADPAARVSHAGVLPVPPERRARGMELGSSDHTSEGTVMLKFLGTTAGIIFLIGLVVVIALLALIF